MVCGQLLVVFVTLQRYGYSSKSQQCVPSLSLIQWCLWPYKGMDFLANRNMVVFIFLAYLVFVTLQRYGFSSKSQLGDFNKEQGGRCLWPYKGMDFLANHNTMAFIYLVSLVFVTLQRYGFSSKSQRCRIPAVFVIRCLWPYKGMDFLANHNTTM